MNWALIILIIYGGFLTFILLYSISQLQLTISYLRFKEEKEEKTPELPEECPYVTIQLPVYNERHVIARLIDTVCKIDWPLDRFEVQILDDSTDETVEIAKDRVAHWCSKGVDVVHIQRPDRVGYKAGALAYGVDIAKGEYIGVFDADFLPPKDLLVDTIPWFNDDSIGVVQTRWGHINKDNNLLTKLQAFGLDAHFTVEQVGRNTLGHFINFNGTAGIWRKRCIENAGGWNSDTLTEDLDLSYRAQLKGWKFKYLENVVSPAELPSVMNALKTQQYRWNKGAAECVVKNLPRVLRDKNLPLNTKIHALFHLMGSSIFICILGTAILSVPVLWIKHLVPELELLFNIAITFTFALVILAVFYWAAHHEKITDTKSFFRFLWTFPVFLSMSMGLSLHNALAVFEGYIGRKTPFVRTPKMGDQSAESGVFKGGYWKSVIAPLTILEVLLAAYAASGIVLAFVLKDGGLVPYHFMLTLGFGSVAYYSIAHSIRSASR